MSTTVQPKYPAIRYVSVGANQDKAPRNSSETEAITKAEVKKAITNRLVYLSHFAEAFKADDYTEALFNAGFTEGMDPKDFHAKANCGGFDDPMVIRAIELLADQGLHDSTHWNGGGKAGPRYITGYDLPPYTDISCMQVTTLETK